MAKFALNIQLGNDTMRTAEDIAIALRKAADALDSGEFAGHGYVHDLNGNNVGEYTSDFLPAELEADDG